MAVENKPPARTGATTRTVTLFPGRGLPVITRACYHACAMNDTIHPGQLEGFRRMTPAQKLRMVADLYEAGIQLRVAGLRMAHPDWPPERLDRHARESLRHAGT